MQGTACVDRRLVIVPGILDAPGIAAWHRTEMRAVCDVIGQGIQAQHYISEVPVTIRCLD